MCVNAIHRHNTDTCVTCDTCVYVKYLKRRQSIYTCVNANYLKTHTKYTHTCVYANYSKSLVSMLYHSKTRVSTPTIKRHTKYIHVCLCQPFKDICQSTYTCVYATIQRQTQNTYTSVYATHSKSLVCMPTIQIDSQSTHTCVHVNHAKKLTGTFLSMSTIQRHGKIHTIVSILSLQKQAQSKHTCVYAISSKTLTNYIHLCLRQPFKDIHKGYTRVVYANHLKSRQSTHTSVYANH